MEARRVIFALFLIVATASAIVVNINACGSYSSSYTNVIYNITNNITATTSSIITNNACVYIDDPHGVIHWNNFTITNLNSNATIGVYIYIHKWNGDRVVNASGTITINNFTYAIFGDMSYTYQRNHLMDFGVVKVQNASILFKGSHYIYSDSPCRPIKADIRFCATDWLAEIYSTNCSGTNPYQVTFSALCERPTIRNAEISIVNEPNTTTNNSYRTINLGFFEANKVFAINGVFSNDTLFSTTQMSNFTIPGANFSTPNTSAIAYLRIKTHKQGYYVNTTKFTEHITAINTTMKSYYCVGGYCNPFYFSNMSTFPHFINVPDTINPVQITNNYSLLRIYWKQGFSNYLVASSKNSEDTTFYLQPNGFYHINIDNQTYDVVNNCPSIFSVCAITLLNNTLGNFSFLMPTGNCSWSANYTANGRSAANVTCCASANRIATLTFQYYHANGTNKSYSYVNTSYCDTQQINVVKAEIKIDGIRVYLSERPFFSLNQDYSFLFFIFLIPLAIVLRRPSYIAGAFSLIVFLGWTMGIISSDFGFIISLVAALFAVIFFRGGI